MRKIGTQRRQGEGRNRGRKKLGRRGAGALPVEVGAEGRRRTGKEKEVWAPLGMNNV